MPRPERRVEHVGGSAPEFLLLSVSRILARPGADCRAVLLLALPGAGRVAVSPNPRPPLEAHVPSLPAGWGQVPASLLPAALVCRLPREGLLAGPGWQPPSCHLCAPEKRSVHQRIRIRVLGELYSKCGKYPLSTIHAHPLKLSSVSSCERKGYGRFS